MMNFVESVTIFLSNIGPRYPSFHQTFVGSRIIFSKPFSNFKSVCQKTISTHTFILDVAVQQVNLQEKEFNYYLLMNLKKINYDLTPGLYS